MHPHQMTLINIPTNKIDQSWKAKEYTLIEGDNPYTIAGDLALNEWAYSDNAVVAVIEDQFEAGLVLEGWEVKSLRAGKLNITESYVLLKKGTDIWSDKKSLFKILEEF